VAGPSPGEIDRVAQFRRALRRFEASGEHIARESGLTPRQYLLLLQIKAAGDAASATAVADSLQLAHSTVTELVTRAVTEGLVRRGPSATDGRVARLSLTQEGERRFAEAFQNLAEERRALREAIGGLL
jgi:DNA-binding MarR family transcriptional regulator